MLFEKIDFDYTYINTLTSTEPNSTRIPMVRNTEKQVLQACIKLCGQLDNNKVRMVLIDSTKNIDTVYMSNAALESVCSKEQVSRVSEFAALRFDEKDNLLLF